MNLVVLGIIVLQFLSGALALSLAVTAFRRRGLAGRPAAYFGLTALAVAVYSWGYGLEVSSSTLGAVLAWSKVEYLGIPYLMPMWILFALSISRRENWINRRRVLALLVVPVVTQVAALTTAWHHLYYIDPQLQPAGPLLTLVFQKGPLYWLGQIYINAGLVFTTGLLGQMLARSAPAFRRQTMLFMLGPVIQWAALLVYLAGHSPYNLDLMSLAMSLSLMVVALGLFRYQGLDVVPLARGMIFEGMDDGVLVLDALDRLIDFNPALQAMLPGVKKTEIGAPAAAVLNAYPALAQQVAGGAPEPVELQVDGARYYRSRLSLLLDRQHRPVGKIMTLSDYSETRQMLEQMRELATRDFLTGVSNRRHFIELAEREIERRRRHEGAISLISLDLDHFKTVNDSYGHAAGDAVLQAVAALFAGMMRKTDVFGRVGGEEFLLLLPETPTAVAQVIAERLRQALDQLTVIYKGQAIRITASFGVSGLDGTGAVSLETLMSYADKAVYDAKAAGRNCVAARVVE